jgi:hypothetical protein
MDLHLSGITVNSILPGRIISEQIRRNYPEDFRKAFADTEIIPVDGGLRHHQF